MNKKILPSHVAIIMDGNGRWAKKRFLPRLAGHKAGVKSLKKIIKYSSNIGIDYLTVYAFSTENWKRPKDEVSGIIKLLFDAILQYIDELIEENVIIKTIGDKSNLSTDILNLFSEVEKKTENNTGMQFNIAFNYGSRNEIIHSVKKIAQLCIDKEISIDDIDENLIESNLYTESIPNPDFVIRTSGEIRLSNFLLWQISYSELYFTDTYWPDFNESEYVKALNEYQNRKRRYGKI
ncbi:MAG: isoprenyl transferase [Bacillota bacterium]|nr:isoprenyl transferase [Bacillota bacterium]